VGKYRILPFLKYKGADEIEAVIVTHPDEDHINGVLELIERGEAEGIRIKNLVLPEIVHELKNTAYKELEWLAQREGVEVSYINSGEYIADNGITMQCLNPDREKVYEEANEYSVVLWLQCGSFQVLLTGDAEGIGEKELTENLKKLQTGEGITVLKAAHHGSKYSTSTELLDILSPQLTVISCGENNRYGHPHRETLERLAAAGSPVLTTPDCGAITVEVGKSVVVRSFCEEVN
jgi:competence protein ComEC